MVVLVLQAAALEGRWSPVEVPMTPLLFAMVDAVLESMADLAWRFDTTAATREAEQHLGWWRSTW